MVCKYSSGQGSSACLINGCNRVSGQRNVTNNCTLVITVSRGTQARERSRCAVVAFGGPALRLLGAASLPGKSVPAAEPRSPRSARRLCPPASLSPHPLAQVEKEMAAPVYLYYELDNFYQNHRRYVKSRSDSQLRGEILSASSLSSDCDPLIYGDIPNSKGELRVLHPCGLIANSYFNDTFALRAAQHDGNNVPVSWSESGISWATDRLNKFKAVPASTRAANNETHQFISETYPGVASVEDEHFIVWMRTAALPRFRKLYARIDTTLKANTRLSIDIGENFPVKQFGGAKSVVISTLSILGGKNDFLGIAYIAVGAVCAAMAVAFLIKECTCPRRPGDLKYLRLSAR